MKASTYEKVQRRQNKDNVKEWALGMELSLVAHLIREHGGAGSNPMLQFTLYPLALFWSLQVRKNTKFLLTLQYEKNKRPLNVDDNPSQSWANFFS